MKDEVGALACEDDRKTGRPETRRGKRRTATPVTMPLDDKGQRLVRRNCSSPSDRGSKRMKANGEARRDGWISRWLQANQRLRPTNCSAFAQAAASRFSSHSHRFLKTNSAS